MPGCFIHAAGQLIMVPGLLLGASTWSPLPLLDSLRSFMDHSELQCSTAQPDCRFCLRDGTSKVNMVTIQEQVEFSHSSNS